MPSRNIYEQQNHNKWMTRVIMLGFILFLGFLGFGFDYFYLGIFENDFYLPIGTIIAVVVGTIMAVSSLESGAKSVLRSTGATQADPNNPTHQQLINVVEEMSIASGMPKPQVFVVPDLDPNAFATGKDPEHSYVAVTQGLLDTLNREELQGVIAHEMSHVRNYDIRLMTVVAAFVGAIVLLSDSGRRGARFGGLSGRGNKSRSSGLGGVFLILWLIGIVLAPLIAQLMAMMVSRRREYLADASGAELTRNPLGLASALQKLDKASAATESIKRGSAHLCIVDPLGRSINSKEGFAAELFGTHPPIEKRVLALDAMAYQYKTTTTSA
ncbi:MAG: M48 family metallopeptidase [Ignavibacteriales bacterium]|nr:M48 family metallopeptidase [Ignavibacteriales bacterium]